MVITRYCKKCGEVIPQGCKACPDCYREYKKKIEETRPNRIERGYDQKWVNYSKQYLKVNPFCVRCLEDGVYTPSAVTDHIIPHRQDKDLFWDISNHQALCKSCHDRKTAKEDGGFKRRI